MPTRIHPYWEHKIVFLKVNNPNWGAERISTKIEKEAVRDQRDDCPSEATVRRVIKRSYNLVNNEERRKYRLFFWPESMLNGDLPWEASEPGIQLLRRLIVSVDKDTENSFETRRSLELIRPTVRQVEWLWHVNQAIPGATGLESVKCEIDPVRMAEYFHKWETIKDSDRMKEEAGVLVRDLEWSLIEGTHTPELGDKGSELT